MVSMSEGRTRSSCVVFRAAAWVAAAFLIITAGNVRSAAAGPAAGPSPAASSDIQALAMPLAAGDSCDAGMSPAPQFSYFEGGSPFAAAAARLLPAPPAAGDLHVMCALPFTTGKPGGDCEGKHK